MFATQSAPESAKVFAQSSTGVVDPAGRDTSASSMSRPAWQPIENRSLPANEVGRTGAHVGRREQVAIASVVGAQLVALLRTAGSARE